MILGQFRHLYAHLGNINATTILRTGQWPRVVGLEGDLSPLLLACVAGRLDPAALRIRPDPCVAVVMASRGYPGAYPKGVPIAGLEAAGRREGVVVFHAGTAPAAGGDGIVTAGGRVLAVTATAPTMPAAVARAYTALAEISFNGAHYRRDIAHRALAGRT